MACETNLKPRQTIQQRATEVRAAVTKLDALLKKKKAKVVVGPKGEIAFVGWDGEERDGITDACAFRRIMVTGSSLAKMEIERAYLAAGKTINRQVIAQGGHTHDGGQNWHSKG